MKIVIHFCGTVFLCLFFALTKAEKHDLMNSSSRRSAGKRDLFMPNKSHKHFSTADEQFIYRESYPDHSSLNSINNGLFAQSRPTDPMNPNYGIVPRRRSVKGGRGYSFGEKLDVSCGNNRDDYMTITYVGPAYHVYTTYNGRIGCIAFMNEPHTYTIRNAKQKRCLTQAKNNKQDSRWQVEVRVQKGPVLDIRKDRRFNIQCRYNKHAYQVIAEIEDDERNTVDTVVNVDEYWHHFQLDVVDMNNRKLSGEINRNQIIQLKLLFSPPDNESGIFVDRCNLKTANETKTIISEGCGTGEVLESRSGFKEQGAGDPTSLTAISDYFSSSSLPKNQSFIFQCSFIVCKNQTECSQFQCENPLRNEKTLDDIEDSFSYSVETIRLTSNTNRELENEYTANKSGSVLEKSMSLALNENVDEDTALPENVTASTNETVDESKVKPSRKRIYVVTTISIGVVLVMLIFMSGLCCVLSRGRPTNPNPWASTENRHLELSPQAAYLTTPPAVQHPMSMVYPIWPDNNYNFRNSRLKLNESLVIEDYFSEDSDNTEYSEVPNQSLSPSKFKGVVQYTKSHKSHK